MALRPPSYGARPLFHVTWHPRLFRLLCEQRWVFGRDIGKCSLNENVFMINGRIRVAAAEHTANHLFVLILIWPHQKEIADKRNVNVSKVLFVLFLRGFLKFLPILAHAFLPVRQCDCQGLQKSPGLVRQARPSSIENSRSSPW